LKKLITSGFKINRLITLFFPIFFFFQSLTQVVNKNRSECNSSITVEKLNKKSTCDSGSLYVYIIGRDTKGTNISNKPGGKSILKIFQRGEYDIHFVVITKSLNGWFKIDGPIYGSGDNGEIVIPGNEGWIHGSVLFADTKTPSDRHNYLYLSTSRKSKIVYEIKNSGSRVKLLDMCGEWVKVEYKGVQGWIESIRLCGYFFTTCS
jgi:hypothetical protein